MLSLRSYLLNIPKYGTLSVRNYAVRQVDRKRDSNWSTKASNRSNKDKRPAKKFKSDSSSNYGSKYGNKSDRKSDKASSTEKRPTKHFQYGEYGQLSEGDPSLLERSRNLVSKITDFEQLKILPDVRSKMIEIIASESLLNKSLKSVEYDPTGENVQQFMKDLKPSPIQKATIHKISKSLMKPELQVRLLAAETGSGKTMAYLIPLVDYLKRIEVETPEKWESLKDKAIVRAIILLPTHELVEQVYQTVSKLEPALGMRTYKWDAGSSYKGFIDALKGRIDIMVTTPGKILS